MTHPDLPVTWSPVRRDPPGSADLTLTTSTPAGEAVRAYLERLRMVAQLAAAGHGYRDTPSPDRRTTKPGHFATG
jgi:hypothetical protein